LKFSKTDHNVFILEQLIFAGVKEKKWQKKQSTRRKSKCKNKVDYLILRGIAHFF